MEIWTDISHLGESRSIDALISYIQVHSLHNAIGPNNESVLSLAVQNHWKPSVVEALIKGGCDPSCWVSAQGNTLLHQAVIERVSLSSFKTLVQAVDKSILYKYNSRGLTVMHLCMEVANGETTKYAKYLIECGVSLYTRTQYEGRNCLHLAVLKDAKNLIADLMVDQTLLNMRDAYQRTPIFYASSYDTLKLMISKGRVSINFWVKDQDDLSILLYLTKGKTAARDLYKTVRLFNKWDLLDWYMEGGVYDQVPVTRAVVRWARIKNLVKNLRIYRERNMHYYVHVAMNLGIAPITRMSITKLFSRICHVAFINEVARSTVNTTNLLLEPRMDNLPQYSVVIEENGKNYYFDWRSVWQMRDINPYTQTKFDQTTKQKIKDRNRILSALDVVRTSESEESSKAFVQSSSLVSKLNHQINQNFLLSADTHRIKWLLRDLEELDTTLTTGANISRDGLLDILLNSCRKVDKTKLEDFLQNRLLFEDFAQDLRKDLGLMVLTALETTGNAQFNALYSMISSNVELQNVIQLNHVAFMVSPSTSINYKRFFFVSILLTLSKSSLVYDHGRRFRQMLLMSS